MASAKEWSERTLGFLAHDVARFLRKRLEQRARAAGIGLTRAQWQTLAYLARSEGINQTCLAQLLDKLGCLSWLVDHHAGRPGKHLGRAGTGVVLADGDEVNVVGEAVAELTGPGQQDLSRHDVMHSRCEERQEGPGPPADRRRPPLDDEAVGGQGLGGVGDAAGGARGA